MILLLKLLKNLLPKIDLVKDVALEMSDLTKKEIDRALNPLGLIEGGIIDNK